MKLLALTLALLALRLGCAHLCPRPADGFPFCSAQGIDSAPSSSQDTQRHLGPTLVTVSVLPPPVSGFFQTRPSDLFVTVKRTPLSVKTMLMGLARVSSE
jgi:hypothetical protein